MLHSPVPDTATQGDSETTTPGAAATITTASATSAKAKPTPKRATRSPAGSAPKATARPRSRAAVATSAKPAGKPVGKPIIKAPGKAAEKPASKSAANWEVTSKSEFAKADKNAKAKKVKLIRDSFTMPESEYELIAAVKRRCIAKGLAVKKSEVLRAAIVGIAAQSDAAIMAALQALEAIKTGRPPKGQK
jgi:hypothetical protein